MKKRHFIVLVVCLSCNLFFGQKRTSDLVEVDFKIKNVGFWVKGHFENVKAELNLEQSDWTNATLTGKVVSASIRTGNNSRDEHLKNEDYFNIEQFPEISLELVSCEPTKGAVINAKFRLSIKDVIKEVDIPLTVQDTKSAITISGNFKINRLDFGVGKKSIILGNEVVVNFSSTFN